MTRTAIATPSSGDSSGLILVPAAQIDAIWPDVAPRLEAAIEKIEHFESSIQGIRNLLRMQQAQLWLVGHYDFIFLTRIVTTATGARLVVDLVTGTNHRNYEDHLEAIEAWAADLGCNLAEAEIRPGLLPSAKRNGWEPTRLKVFKEIGGRIH